MKFRDDQLPIMKYKGGTMAVSAVPGAGKTFITAQLVCKIIEEKLNKPGKVLVVTYMNSAVNNFKNRISHMLEERGIDSNNDYEVMTIHGLAMKVLQERPDVAGLDENFKVIDDVQKIFYLDNAVKMWRKLGGEKIYRSLLSEYGTKKYDEKGERWWKDFLQISDVLISELKLNRITPKKVEENRELLGNNSIIHILNYIYSRYEKMLSLNGYVDYNDILVLAYKALISDEDLRKKFQQKYSFVFEDECQDSNLVQCDILSIISERISADNKKRECNLVRVGDLNQSIMGSFTSSNPIYFKQFLREADENYVMNRSGRSTRNIMNLANFLVEYTVKNHPEERCRGALRYQKIHSVEDIEDLKNPEVDEYGIYAYSMSSWEDVKRKTIGEVKSFKRKHPDMTLAILIPFNSHVKEIAEELRKNEIECDELSSTSSERLKIINILGKMLGFLGEPDNLVKFRNLMYEIIDGDNEKKNVIINNITSFKIEDILEESVFKTTSVCKLEEIDKNIFEDFICKLRMVKDILSNLNMPLQELILYIGYKLKLNNEDKAILQYVASYVRHKNAENNSVTLDEISQELLDIRSSAFTHICNVIYDIRGYEPVPEKVTVTTYHKSKGLEWDCVFLLYLNNYIYPYSIKGKFRSEHYYFKDEFKNPTAIGKAEVQKLLQNDVYYNPIIKAREEVVCEKIRLLYVAITRAKKYLILMAHYDENKKDCPSKYFEVIKKFICENKQSS
ncbi:ATP-dependent helicase [Clostridium sp. AWRP]|uniref:ATP-dependent helicase n=1 Tax=Clostridium sp. AWRP TaxID=2212991 RepID=UPI000FDA7634|nr:ATP-dependent helicase [Clostridium sp. AWRP]AZV57711.1 ATP-dependent helicase [Clostridium sp. AWRP]